MQASHPGQNLKKGRFRFISAYNCRQKFKQKHLICKTVKIWTGTICLNPTHCYGRAAHLVKYLSGMFLKQYNIKTILTISDFWGLGRLICIDHVRIPCVRHSSGTRHHTNQQQLHSLFQSLPGLTAYHNYRKAKTSDLQSTGTLTLTKQLNIEAKCAQRKTEFP